MFGLEVINASVFAFCDAALKFDSGISLIISELLGEGIYDGYTGLKPSIK